MKKFELTDETLEIDNMKLYRIISVCNFGNVKKGELGGWIEKEENLSHKGFCWIGDDAIVCGNACVLDNAQVFENAYISDDAQIFEDAQVYGNAKISDDAQIFENAQVCGNAMIGDFSRVYGDMCIE